MAEAAAPASVAGEKQIVSGRRGGNQELRAFSDKLKARRQVKEGPGRTMPEEQADEQAGVSEQEAEPQAQAQTKTPERPGRGRPPKAVVEARRAKEAAPAEDQDEGEDVAAAGGRVELSESFEETAKTLGWEPDALLAHWKRELADEGGAKRKVSLADLAKGGPNAETYKRDSEKLRMDRAEFDSTRDKHNRTANQYLTALQQGYRMLQTHMTGGLATSDQLKQMLDQGDMQGYEQAKLAHARHQDTMRRVGGQLQQFEQIEHQKLLEHATSERRKFAVEIAELADEPKTRAFLDKNREYLRGAGFVDAEIDGSFKHDQINDWRMFRILRDAIAGQELKQNLAKGDELKKRLAGLPKPVRQGVPATGRDQGKVASLAEARTRAIQSGGRGQATPISHLRDILRARRAR